NRLRDRRATRRRAPRKWIGPQTINSIHDGPRCGRNGGSLGGAKLAVDCVILIGEHGDCPVNDKAQTLYPRFEMFLKITDVFRQNGRSVPVFNDKHLSYSWRQARRMVEISKELKFPMLAGSSAPVAYRVPSIDTPFGAAQKYAVAISYSGLD